MAAQVLTADFTPAHAPSAVAATGRREFYIDRLRIVMTLIVVFSHTGMTYGGAGWWSYREVPVSSSLSSLLLTVFSVTNQTYLMGLFFLLAGYFTPASFDRKGPRAFLKERILRLGVPILFFAFVIAPLTLGMVSQAQGHGFWPAVMTLWRDKQFINGPLWFAEALLIFSLSYCIWRAITAKINFFKIPARDAIGFRKPPPMPSNFAWLLAAIGVGAGAVLLRQPFPVDVRFFGLWPGYFSSFIFLFALGAVAWRNDWLSRVTGRQAAVWIAISFICWPIFPGTKVYLVRHGIPTYFSGGYSAPAILYAFWEPFVAWGIIAVLLVCFRTCFNHSGKLQLWLSRRAYAVYILHPFFLICISLLLRNWHGLPLVKTFVVTALCCVASWLAADPLVRLPGIRRVV